MNSRGVGKCLIEFCRCMYSVGFPLNTAPRRGTTCRMKDRASRFIIEVPSGSLNSRIAILPAPAAPSTATEEGLTSTRWISQRTASRSITLRMPKAIVATLNDSDRSSDRIDERKIAACRRSEKTASFRHRHEHACLPFKSRASPIRSVTASPYPRRTTFSLPMPIIDAEGSTPRTLPPAPLASGLVPSPAFFSSSANNIATSAVPVAKSKMASSADIFSSRTIRRRQDVSRLRARTRFIRS
mmetsp:Transcript_30229/g.69295  ORF Transcript_30229/g.69295 Transcript_30229/m.69295 type:complete len:242 (+) Transcript_30229:388-1113(+)